MTKDLKHFGVPGMKWGIRNAVSRAKSNFSKSVKQKYGPSKPKGSEDFQKTKQLKKKKLRDLSNDELKTLNNRLQLEQQYKQLSQKKLSKGQKKAQEILGKIGGKVVDAAIKGFTEKMAADFASRYGPGGSGYSNPTVIDTKFLD
jgi:hypothetical protein